MKKDKEKKKKKERRVEEYAMPERAVFPEPCPDMSQPGTFACVGNPEDASTLEQIIALVGGKWKIRILWALRDGSGQRYRSIKLAMPAITDMMLSQSLRELCGCGLVARRQYQEIPPRVEYVITPTGAGILPALQTLIQWAKQLPAELVKGK